MRRDVEVAMKRYHRRKNPNWSYGRCSLRKLTDFRYGDLVVQTVGWYSMSIGHRMIVRSIDIERKVVWCSSVDDGYEHYRFQVIPSQIEFESYWLTDVER